MILLTLAALVGGPLTAALLWHDGVILALAAAPFGASLAAVIAGGFLYVSKPRAVRVTAHFEHEWHAAARI